MNRISSGMRFAFGMALLTAASTLVHAQLFIAPPPEPQTGLGLAPMRVEIKLAAGQVYANTLKLSSGATGKVRVRGEVLDFHLDQKATPQFERELAQEASFSCKKWLSLNPTEIEIDKDGFLMVRYTLRLPADVPEGSYACAAGFTTLPSAEAVQEGMGMRMAVRIVATFYVQVGAPPIEGGLKELSLERLPATPDSKEGLQAVAVLENRGRMYFRPSGKLSIIDAEGKTVEAFDFAAMPVLRERDQRFLFPLKKALNPGKYQMRAQVDVGAKELQRASVDVVIDPAADVVAAVPDRSPVAAVVPVVDSSSGTKSAAGSLAQ